jgi:hypothetical protein
MPGLAQHETTISVEIRLNTKNFSLNEILQLIGESPIKENRLGKVKYPTGKMKRIEKTLKTRILNIPENVS